MSLEHALHTVDHILDHSTHYHEKVGNAIVGAIQNMGNSLNQNGGALAAPVGAVMVAHPVGVAIGVGVLAVGATVLIANKLNN